MFYDATGSSLSAMTYQYINVDKVDYVALISDNHFLGVSTYAKDVKVLNIFKDKIMNTNIDITDLTSKNLERAIEMYQKEVEFLFLMNISTNVFEDRKSLSYDELVICYNLIKEARIKIDSDAHFIFGAVRFFNTSKSDKNDVLSNIPWFEDNQERNKMIRSYPDAKQKLAKETMYRSIIYGKNKFSIQDMCQSMYPDKLYKTLSALKHLNKR